MNIRLTNHPVRRQIRLVVRNECLCDRVGNGLPQFWNPLSQRDGESKQDEADTQDVKAAKLQKPSIRRSSPECQLSSENKEQLPGKRIEVPNARRIGGKIPAVMASCQIQADRSDHHRIAPSQHEPKEDRERGHQYDVERQNIEIKRLELEQKTLQESLDGHVHQGRDVELIHQMRIVELMRKIVNRSEVKK